MAQNQTGKMSCAAQISGQKWDKTVQCMPVNMAQYQLNFFLSYDETDIWPTLK